MIRAVGAKLDYVFIRHILLGALLHNNLLHIEKFKTEHYGKLRIVPKAILVVVVIRLL